MDMPTTVSMRRMPAIQAQSESFVFGEASVTDLFSRLEHVPVLGRFAGARGVRNVWDLSLGFHSWEATLCGKPLDPCE